MGKIIAIMVVIGAVFGGAYFMRMGNSPKPDVKGAATEIVSGTTFYYGAECPHCKDVEKFIADNKIADKVKYETKEVWHDQTNSQEMVARAKTCGLDPNSIGVPFVYSDGKCSIGTPDVEAFFKKAAGL